MWIEREMESTPVTVSDIVDVLNLSSAWRTKETSDQLPLPPSIGACILVARGTCNTNSEVLIGSQSLEIIPGNEQKTGRQHPLTSCHRLYYHQSKDVSKEIPLSFLSQKRYNVASLGRSVTLGDFRTRLSNFEGKRLDSFGPLDECQKTLNSSEESSSALINNSFDSDGPYFRRWKSFVNDMGMIVSTQDQHPYRRNPNEKSREEYLDDPVDWSVHRRPIRNRFEETMDGGNTTRLHGVARSSDRGKGVSSANRRPGRYFLEDGGDNEIDQPRRERINFRLLAAQLFRPKRRLVSVAPKTYDTNIYCFASPLSEEFDCLDLVALSREGRDWRSATDARPKDPTEEKILDRLLRMKRLEEETVDAENAERASRGSQCRGNEQPPRQTRLPGCLDSAGRSESSLVRGLERDVNRLSMKRSCVERATSFRKTELKDDASSRQPRKRLTSKRSQLERHDEGPSEQPPLVLSPMLPSRAIPGQVKGHRLTSDDTEVNPSEREGSSGPKLKAGYRKRVNGRLTLIVSGGKTFPSLRSVSLADPHTMPRLTKPTSSSSLSSGSAASTKTLSQRRLKSTKKRSQTAVVTSN